MDCRPASIHDVKEYTNLLAVREYIDDLVKNCFSLYESFEKVVKADEARNEPLKLDMREYQYHHNYLSECLVHVFTLGGGSNDYKTYDAFALALNSGNVQGVSELTIRLDLGFRRGKHATMDEHDHKFTIKFKPENCSFSYEANYDDASMNDIRDKLVAKLDAFPATTTIFSRPN